MKKDEEVKIRQATMADMEQLCKVRNNELSIISENANASRTLRIGVKPLDRMNYCNLFWAIFAAVFRFPFFDLN